jgi:hypothetical protein
LRRIAAASPPRPAPTTTTSAEKALAILGCGHADQVPVAGRL